MTTVLHIEDNPSNRMLVQRVLDHAGFHVIHAPDGESGIRSALSTAPDLILIDMGLPDIDGQTVVALLKQMPQLRGIPLVMITAWPAEKALEMARRYGFDGCILKPIDVRRFPAELAAYLAPGQRPVPAE
jgi:two-component system cell cycle response regulator DivK